MNAPRDATAPPTDPAPPRRHGVMARQLGSHGAAGELWLPVCAGCGRIVYPLRELCPDCLSERLAWQPVSATGELLASTTLHHSNEPYFRPRLPLRIGSVRLDGPGRPVLVAFLDEAAARPGARVRVTLATDDGGALHAHVAS